MAITDTRHRNHTRRSLPTNRLSHGGIFKRHQRATGHPIRFQQGDDLGSTASDRGDQCLPRGKRDAIVSGPFTIVR